jgi:hypothetical protein
MSITKQNILPSQYTLFFYIYIKFITERIIPNWITRSNSLVIRFYSVV